ncbi:MAG: hypothetical protein ACP5E2_12075 [Terracidiphilus sp.]
MRTIRSLSILVAAILTCLTSLAWAQGGAGRYYNPNTEISARGAVEKVTTVTSGPGWYGVHLTLKSQDRTYDVRLGPSAFITQSNFTFAVGDQIEVWGSQVDPSNGVIVARAVEKNGQTLTLRDANGFPAWAGMGMRGHGRGYGGGCPGCGCRHCGCGCRGGCNNN